MAESKPEQNTYQSVEEVKAPNLMERAKEEVTAIAHTDRSPKHHIETHGTSDDIDENTKPEEIKGPSVFQRAKEEIEALVEAIHPKKESSSSDDHSKKDGGGFFASIGRSLEKVCSPKGKKT
ncbi:hypothetical protein MKW98_016501 [Papaver atlanticum]|uniref:Uncharacterized protein n=1 Tax=Papaver atlanticum TaxID=357466 RepID=A0AAD4T9J1_9MAGN|nr:hypothetical protein MKW98_016501 [Papaver atlanticum]